MAEEYEGDIDKNVEDSLDIKDDEFVIDENDDEEFDPFIDELGLFRTTHRIEYHMAEWGIKGNKYSLDAIDDAVRDYLDMSKHLCRSRDDEHKLEIIIRRSEWNSSTELCSVSEISNLFDMDTPCAAIYACNTLIDALASILGVTEMDDTASYALCILLARRHGLFTEEEIDILTDLFEYRDLCATNIEVDQPSEEQVEKWKTLLYRTMADMYVKAMM